MCNTNNFHDNILEHFEKWNFTKAEAEIGLLILQGLSLRLISQKRGTSETTIRQQALSLYKKASVEGRHELSGFFLNLLLNGTHTMPFGQVEQNIL